MYNMPDDDYVDQILDGIDETIIEINKEITQQKLWTSILETTCDVYYETMMKTKGRLAIAWTICAVLVVLIIVLALKMEAII